MRICVIFNPAARGQKASRLRRHLDALSGAASIKLSSASGGARQMASEAVREGFETVVAAGGDGTVNEVLNGIGDESGGFERTRLGVLPLGTVNVFAKELGLPERWADAWAVICAGCETRIDLPRVEFGADGQRQCRFFAQLAGAGMDARAIECVSWEFKKRAPYASYVLAVWQAWREPQGVISVSTAAGSASGEWVLIGNGRFYAGKFRVFPRADLCDGVLDVCVFPRLNWGTSLGIAWTVLRDRLEHHPGLRHFQAPVIELTGAARTLLELDGELVGELPARFSVEPRKLRVIIPE